MIFKKFFRSFAFASKGIALAFRSQFNLRLHILIAVIVLALSAYFRLSPIEWCIVLFCIASVIAAELLNTSIEITVDLAMPEHDQKAGMSKDIAAAAVLVVSFVSACIGCIIFGPRVFNLI